MGKVRLEKLEVYAYHGLLEEERKIGGPFEVDIEVETDFMEAAQSDDFTNTVDYGTLARIAQEEMAIPAKLLENVALRIAKRVNSECGHAKHCTVTVRKMHPPIPFKVGSTSVTLQYPAINGLKGTV